MPSAHEANPDPPSCIITIKSYICCTGLFRCLLHTGGIVLVGSYSRPNYRHSLSHSNPSAGPDNGRFNDGLGIDLPGQGYLDHRGGQSSHELMGYFPIAQSLRAPSLRQMGNGAIGQLNSCLLKREALLRRDKVPRTLSACQEYAILVLRSPDILYCSPHPGSIHPGRQSFQGDISEPNGVVNIQILIGGSNDLHRNVVAHNRSVCFQPQPSTPGLLLQIKGPEGSSGRYAIDPVIRDISLHIPTDIAHSEGEQGRLHSSTHSPVLTDQFWFHPSCNWW